MLEPGQIVGGKFRIERVLGEGGMGLVAVATHLQLEQQVALKVVHAAIAHDRSVVERFQREARASAKLKSEHVCRVSDVGTLEDGSPYLVMELMEGADLSAVIASGPLAVPVAVDYVLQACVAVAEAHALGIVHRDLKPANLFLTHRLDGTPLVKVLDFGIAKVQVDGDFKMTRTSTVMGSPGYMSPEQLRSAKDVDARTDVWALGVILYELVSGKLPFPADTITELAVRVTVDPPQPLDGIDPAFAAVVFKCLEKDAAVRFQSVTELAAALAPLGGQDAGSSLFLIGRVSSGGSSPAFSATGAPRTGVSGSGALGAAASSALPARPPTAPTAALPSPTTLGAAAGQSAAALPAKKKRSAVPFILGGLLVAGGAAAAAFVVTSKHDATPAGSGSAALVASTTPTAVPAPISPAPTNPTPSPAPPPTNPTPPPAPVSPAPPAPEPVTPPTPPPTTPTIGPSHPTPAPPPAPPHPTPHVPAPPPAPHVPAPHPDEPHPGADPELDRLRTAMDKQNYGEALSIAESLLRDSPNDHGTLVMGALAACKLHRPRVASGMVQRLPGPRRAVVYQTCLRDGVDLRAEETAPGEGDHRRHHRRGDDRDEE
ncbi:MAG TPA: serine/threonine-protein kinase [Kofleriaceae bacterium]|jgi:serine/threonine-protein kinase